MKSKRTRIILKIVIALMWAAIITVCALNIDKITIDSILEMTPEGAFITVLFIWLLFIMKSLSVVVHFGIISAACGAIFPLYFALPINLIGVAFMASVPFLIGRSVGEEGAGALMKKYPRLHQVDMSKADNVFLYSFVIRLIGLLPSDPVSALFGALGMGYKTFIFSSVTGMCLETIIYTVAGRSIMQKNIPVLIAAAVIKVFISTAAVIVIRKIKKKPDKEADLGENNVYT